MVVRQKSKSRMAGIILAPSPLHSTFDVSPLIKARLPDTVVSATEVPSFEGDDGTRADRLGIDHPASRRAGRRITR